jgi:hypothetical protein
MTQVRHAPHIVDNDCKNCPHDEPPGGTVGRTTVQRWRVDVRLMAGVGLTFSYVSTPTAPPEGDVVYSPDQQLRPESKGIESKGIFAANKHR